MRFMGTLFFALLVFGNIKHADADAALVRRPEVRAFIQQLVKQHHFDQRQLFAMMKEAKYQPNIIASMERPYEMKPWDVYKALFLTPERVQAGLAFWQANQAALDRAEKQYGVPAQMIVAIIGVETLYGKHQGEYRVLDALTTLAFYYPKRSPYFTRELAEFFQLCREQGVSPSQYRGSYAGAMGKPQFMPSSYRFYAVDFTGKGQRDLMHSDHDAIGSVANYFHRHGWQKSRAVAQPAVIAGSHYKQLAINSKTPNYALKRLLADGVRPRGALLDHPNKAGLMEFTTQTGREFWLAYPNFYVITRYNSSPQYALVVYLFSQQLHKQWAALRSGHRQLIG
jgi:membrane-bound lytic murein transglycosylase B